jgi:hypothetical protein
MPTQRRQGTPRAGRAAHLQRRVVGCASFRVRVNVGARRHRTERLRERAGVRAIGPREELARHVARESRALRLAGVEGDEADELVRVDLGPRGTARRVVRGAERRHERAREEAALGARAEDGEEELRTCATQRTARCNARRQEGVSQPIDQRRCQPNGTRRDARPRAVRESVRERLEPRSNSAPHA